MTLTIYFLYHSIFNAILAEFGINDSNTSFQLLKQIEKRKLKSWLSQSKHSPNVYTLLMYFYFQKKPKFKIFLINLCHYRVTAVNMDGARQWRQTWPAECPWLNETKTKTKRMQNVMCAFIFKKSQNYFTFKSETSTLKCLFFTKSSTFLLFLWITNSATYNLFHVIKSPSF